MGHTARHLKGGQGQEEQRLGHASNEGMGEGEGGNSAKLGVGEEG